MRRTLGLALVPVALLALVTVGVRARPATNAGPKLAHIVVVTLKDHSKEARDKFIASCQKYLTNHEGTSDFIVGALAEDVEEPGVTVKDFDVAFTAVFDDKAAKERYLVHPRHKQFVDENRASFEKVRVFDVYLAAP